MATGAFDQGFLHGRQSRITDLDAEIAARDHDAIRCVDDLINVIKRFSAFDLRDDAGLAAGFCDQLTRDLNVVTIAWKGDRDVVRTERQRVYEIFAILGGQCLCREPAAFAIQSFEDELAHAAGKDPVEYALELLGPDRIIPKSELPKSYSNYGASYEQYPIDTARFKRVVETAAEKSGWAKTKPGNGAGISHRRHQIDDRLGGKPGNRRGPDMLDPVYQPRRQQPVQPIKQPTMAGDELA